jgi:ubiquinone/menaquinone biosynthesis C-methylase UbiE
VLKAVENQVNMIVQYLRELSFQDSSFDVVVSLVCIHNIDNKQEQRAARLEIARVLKPGGHVLIGELASNTQLRQRLQ